jgi:hypothetical protein
MYLTLTALIQLNLIATRNPSFWWRFSKKTAPRCTRVQGLPTHSDTPHPLAAVGASRQHGMLLCAQWRAPLGIQPPCNL